MSKEPEWVMPEWMEPYRAILNNTGGNRVENLMNDHETSVQINAPRAMICVAVKCQVSLLMSLHRQGLLAPTGLPEAAKYCAKEMLLTLANDMGAHNRLEADPVTNEWVKRLATPLERYLPKLLDAIVLTPDEDVYRMDEVEGYEEVAGVLDAFFNNA